MRSVAAAILILTLAAQGCAAERDRALKHEAAALPHGMLGCYELFIRGGLPAPDSLYFTSPKVRLDSAASPAERLPEHPRAWSLVRLDANGREMDHGRRSFPTFWSPDSLSDSVHLIISSGYSGTELILPLPAGSDTLHGRAVEHGDAGPPFSRDAGAVTAVRIPCVAGEAP